MKLQTNLPGRLRNTSLPKSHGLLPVFETVINAIHALEERGNPTTGKIILRIHRDTQQHIDNLGNRHPDITGFSIEDNGIGFNDTNLKSFETLDSDHKIDKGCRGVGRLLWLKAFDHITISSQYKDEQGNYNLRTIHFNVQHGIQHIKEEQAPENQYRTIVTLQGFKKRYRESTPRTIDSLSDALLEHCLWYFVRPGGAPDIDVIDQHKAIRLNDRYDDAMHASACTESIAIKGQDFELTHIKFRASSTKKHSISLCAAGRLVKEESLAGKIPGLYGKISDDDGTFIYSCYVASPYLDERVRAERTAFDISEDNSGLFSATELSLDDIRTQTLERAKAHLNKYLQENLTAGKRRVSAFVSEKAPRYRPVMSRMPEEALAIDPAISDKELELHLHKNLAEIESDMLAQGHDIMHMLDSNPDDYQDKLKQYLQRAEDIKQSDLASYVSHRRVIIDLLEKSIQPTDSGRYAKEELIHDLIMPMRKESGDILAEACNLWLVDERLAFHNYLASDKTLKAMPITGNDSTKEPDICALNVYDNPILISESQKLPLASITIVEIKRPMRNDAKPGENKDPIAQALGYLNKIRKGQVKTASGRPIPNSDDIPGYCYILCDLTPSVIERCQFFDLTVASDHMSYFGFHKQYKAYIEVISFDKLVNSAKERNRAFFDKLGLPAN